jgi:multisubunit Na+/H+ antiporter MnhG subunit
MTTAPSTPWQPAKPERLSRQFSRLGWLGFWIQVGMLAIPLVLLAYVLFVRSPDSPHRIGIDLSNYLSYGSLLIMVFTTFWFLRYARIGKRIPDPELRPPRASVERTLWIGLWASGLGIAFSMILLFSAVGRILFILLANPQTGIMIAPGPGGNPVQSISAIDAISLTSLLVILAAELIVLGFSVWLLFRTTRAPAAPEAADAV